MKSMKPPFKATSFWNKLDQKRISHPDFFQVLHCRRGFSSLPLWAKWMHGIFLFNLVIAIASLILSTEPSVAKTNSAQVILFSVDLVCCFIFAVEFFIAVYSAPRYSDLCTMMHFVDFMSFFPRFVVFFTTLGSHRHALSYGYVAKSGFDTVNMTSYRIVRIFRVLRLLRYVRMSLRVRLMVKSLKNSSGILMIVIVLPLMMLIYSMLICFAEQTEMSFVEGQWVYPDGTVSPFQSIPSAFWITLLILTGEGLPSDTPKSVLAEFIAGVAMISSIFLVAFPVTMVTIQIQQAVRYFGLKQRLEASKKSESYHHSDWDSWLNANEPLDRQGTRIDPSQCVERLPIVRDPRTRSSSVKDPHVRPHRLVIDKWWLTTESSQPSSDDVDSNLRKKVWSSYSARPSMEYVEKDVLVLDIEFENDDDMKHFIATVAL